MKNIILRKGLTLIELLVVIAIIGVLASVVLASLNSARNKGKDARIQSSLSNLTRQAALYHSDNLAYGSGATYEDCSTIAVGMYTDSNISAIITSAIEEAGTPSSGASSYCGVYSLSGTDNYAVAVALNGQSDTSWCVDSQGFAGLLNMRPTSAVASFAVCNN